MESLDEKLYLAVIGEDNKAVSCLLNEGANINTICSSGRTPLGIAAGLGNIPILQTLLSNVLPTTTPENFKKRDVELQQSPKRNRRKKVNREITQENSCVGTFRDNVDLLQIYGTNRSRPSCQSEPLIPKDSDLGILGLHFHNSVPTSPSQIDSTNSGCNLGYFVVIHNDRDSNGEISASSTCRPTVDENWNNGGSSGCGLNDVETPDGMDKLEWDVEVEDVEESGGAEDSFASLYRWYADILDKTSSMLQLPQRCDVNHQDIYGRGAVHYAAEHGCVHALRLLTTAGCRVDVGDFDSLTPLHLAAARGHCAVAELLLGAGIDANRKTSDKTSSLHIAASRGYADLVQVLLNANANVDSLDASDRTPLMVAVSRGHDETVQLLIKHGAKVNVEEIHGYTPLCEAVWQKAVPIVQMLLDAGAKITQSHYLLHYAVLHRHVEMAKLLLQAGSIVNLRDDNGNTPLIVAAMTGHLQLAQLLLVNGASANYPNALTGSTPLHEAVEHIRECEYPKFEEIFTVLRSYGALLNIETSTGGDTPLFRAILLEKYRAAMLLIRHGTDVNLCETETCYVDNLCLAQRRNSFALSRLIVYAGFNLCRSTPYLKPPTSSTDTDSISGWLTYMKYNPMRLTDLCRLVIRKQCGENVYKKINSSGLPKILKKFILLEDVGT